MSTNNRTPEEKRERLRQEELRNNPTGSLNDGLRRAENGNLQDVAGGMGWKGMLGTIVLIIVIYVIYKTFFG